MWNAVSETEMPDMKHKESEVFGRRICTCVHARTLKSQQIARRAHACICADTHLNRDAPGFLRLLLCFISFSWEPALPSTCGAIISWHTYPPLNDFSSSPASHLIKVESLMPFRDPTAFSRIHCHYENEWRQLRTQMFFHIVTESLLMCLVIFTVAAFDWRPWLVPRLIMLLILHITFGFCLCSASPFLTRSLSHRDH